MNTRQKRYILLDRDGVINRRIPNGYVTSWDKFDFLPGALEGLRLLALNNFTTLIVSNQSCVGKGLISSRDLDTLTQRFLIEVALAGGHIAHVYYCRHSENDCCSCRKPLPGLINEAQSHFHFLPSETFLVGDSRADLQAADAAGCPSIFLKRGSFLNPAPLSDNTELVVSSLLEAVEAILALQASVAAPSPPLARLQA
jgi:D-glycero-D-manno-heptose 1,7-bisphosphate phosphatase